MGCVSSAGGPWVRVVEKRNGDAVHMDELPDTSRGGIGEDLV